MLEGYCNWNKLSKLIAQCWANQFMVLSYVESALLRMQKPRKKFSAQMQLGDSEVGEDSFLCAELGWNYRYNSRFAQMV